MGACAEGPWLQCYDGRVFLEWDVFVSWLGGRAAAGQAEGTVPGERVPDTVHRCANRQRWGSLAGLEGRAQGRGWDCKGDLAHLSCCPHVPTGPHRNSVTALQLAPAEDLTPHPGFWILNNPTDGAWRVLAPELWVAPPYLVLLPSLTSEFKWQPEVLGFPRGISQPLPSWPLLWGFVASWLPLTVALHSLQLWPNWFYFVCFAIPHRL